MKEEDKAHLKEKLQEELSLLERELGEVGRRNPSNKNDWVATPGDMDISTADKNEVADKMEEFEERSNELDQLEIQYNDVKAALKRMEEGTYGVCEKGGEEIPLARLEAFPAAATCIEHAG